MSIEALQRRIVEAAENRIALRLRGGGSKDFYGNEPRGETLDLAGHSGIIAYEPSELVVTARCGTSLAELEERLAANGQRLPFEPPHFGASATVGGCIAAGLSGPARASAGAVRDFVLGTKVIDGRGRILSFGGQVMKNVAGYDVSRLMAGALGTLGVIVEASLKVLPRAAQTTTLRMQKSQADALAACNGWAAQPLPISATAWENGMLSIRLSGAQAGVRAAAQKLGGDAVPDQDAFWAAIREHKASFFAGGGALWRLSVPSTTAPLELAGTQLIEWNGGLRWLRSSAPAADIREAARRAGGSAALFRAADKSAGAFASLDAVKMRLHRELKAVFDPAGILNPGRMYPEL